MANSDKIRLIILSDILDNKAYAFPDEDFCLQIKSRKIISPHATVISVLKIAFIMNPIYLKSMIMALISMMPYTLQIGLFSLGFGSLTNLRK